MASQVIQRFFGWIWPALAAPAGRSPVKLKDDIQTGIDLFGSSRWASPSIYTFTSGSGVASYDLPPVPRGYIQIWTHGNLKCSNEGATRTLSLSVVDPLGNEVYVARRYCSSIVALQSLELHRPFVVPMDCFLRLRCVGILAGETMTLSAFYHEVPAGEYIRTTDG